MAKKEDAAAAATATIDLSTAPDPHVPRFRCRLIRFCDKPGVDPDKPRVWAADGYPNEIRLYDIRTAQELVAAGTAALVDGEKFPPTEDWRVPVRVNHTCCLDHVHPERPGEWSKAPAEPGDVRWYDESTAERITSHGGGVRV